MKLSVLDQSLARSADEPDVALQESLDMARWCEALGYERFWVSEHHAFPAVAGSAPEVLLAALGAATLRIRLGSGGIMLPHYSPYKVAECFSLLANLYPGRIDLGVGRAPGADMATAVALATDGRPKFERFPELVTRLDDYLRNPAARPLVSPRPPADLPLWMLGSSPDSALLAAERGLPYNLGLFINPQAAPELVHLYRARFRPSARLGAPYAIITTSVFCADDEPRARALQLTYDLNLYRFVTDQSIGRSLTPGEALDYPLGPREQAFIASRGSNRAVGTPGQVRGQLEALAERFAADEIMAVSNMYYLEDRKRSFELLMDAFK
ncbi:LLM class flavin-dependent oxidoreductase [Parahaliea mediterranea]|uniref:LLM class flavin-dependent oxidoreductase n=1 Tax=Parahaliea mediterranea TaxID=651086 RepID=A0A939IJY8_9GAMM|nr:LLM class flavin-dependent oxidoreductase [Parahaliea mediterranea]MBN7798194.1 LLM class flavin-dependent oxidoreductase [Parahaliea mediterranea]